MIVVSNTSPINYLILIELEHLLPRLFGTVIVPTAVRQELQVARAPQRVRELIGISRWIDVRAPAKIDSRLAALGAGERETLALALELKADLVLLDESRPPGRVRTWAERHGNPGCD
jgi:predicted nucleic acid-binding protein